MDTCNGPAVTVAGEVIFDNYEDGAISIFARTEDRTRPPDIAILTIPKRSISYRYHRIFFREDCAIRRFFVHAL